MSHRSVFVVVAFVAALGMAIGCGKSEKSESGDKPKSEAPPAAAPEKKAEPAAAPEKKAEPAAPAAATAASGCAKLFAAASAKLDMAKMSCIESSMEEKEFEFDSDACDDLEDAWALGVGDFAGLWKKCQADEKFDDATCDAVVAKCF